MENDGDRHDDRKFLERLKKLTLLASNSVHSLNISNHWNIPYNHRHVMSKGNVHVIIVVEKTTLQIARILVTRPKIRRSSMSVQLVGVVVDNIVDTEMDEVADANVTTRSV